MTDFELDSAAFKLNPHYRFQWEEAQQCHVLLYPEGLIKLSGSATEIIQRCQQETSMDELINDLQQTFPEAEGLAEDVKEFLKDAQRQAWIVAVND